MRRSFFLSCALVTLALAGRAAAAPVQQISSDPFTNSTSQHATEVEPDTFAFGDTVVAAFQAGRFTGDGGASGIGFATSLDAGKTWASGFLPSLTVYSTPAGTLERATDPSVAYDAAHKLWLISTIGIVKTPTGQIQTLWVSRSSDGLVWSAPVSVPAPEGSDKPDKDWIVCDNGAASPFRGRCYVAYSDDPPSRAIVDVTTSTDGGLVWSAPVKSADPAAVGNGVQPVVQPDGTLVVPFLGTGNGELLAIRSTDGGATFGGAVKVADVRTHPSAGIRAHALPSVDVDGAGTIFIAWRDCRFRGNCPWGSPPTKNDILLAKSADGVTWTAPARVPVDDLADGVDHFVPGLAVDPDTKGAQARLALTYFTLGPDGTVGVGFVSSENGGETWTAPFALSDTSMALSALPETDDGRMVGDYISTSVASGVAIPVFPLAAPFDGAFHQAMFAGAINLRPAPTPPPVAPQAPAPSPLPPPPALTFAPVSVGPRSVSIAASRAIVVYGQNVTLAGAVSSGQAGEEVQLNNGVTVATSTGGLWTRVVTPRMLTVYRARWGDVASATVSIGVRPHVALARRGRAFAVKVVAAQSFAGRKIELQRRASREWRTVATARLRARSAARITGALPRGRSLIRAVLPQSETGHSYLAGFSSTLAVRR